MPTCLHTYTLACVHAYMHLRTCLHAYMPLFAYTSLYVYMLTCLHAYLRVHVATHLIAISARTIMSLSFQGSEHSKTSPDPYCFWVSGPAWYGKTYRSNLFAPSVDKHTFECCRRISREKPQPQRLDRTFPPNGWNRRICRRRHH